jgi:hypothetical protein
MHRVGREEGLVLAVKMPTLRRIPRRRRPTRGFLPKIPEGQKKSPGRKKARLIISLEEL